MEVRLTALVPADVTVAVSADEELALYVPLP
jgi:hypothetical protein